MVENCLADTGMGQNTILIIAALIAAGGVGLFLLSRRYKLRGSFLAAVLVFAAAMFITAQPVAAQSNECTGEEVTGLRLVNDTYEGVINEEFELAIVSNDLFPAGDAIDWGTLDLEPGDSDVDVSTNLFHPNAASYSCGFVTYDPDRAAEAVIVYIDPECYGEVDSIPLPSQLVFYYTAKSQSGIKAPKPAKVTITLDQVIVSDQSIHINFNSSTEGSVNVADGATTVVGTIDRSSVDLDPSNPGQQTSIVVPAAYDPDIDVTIEVDSDGLVTLTVASVGDTSCQTGTITVDIPFTIKNNAGKTSNQAVITSTFSNECA